jgi:hypothetical protein
VTCELVHMAQRSSVPVSGYQQWLTLACMCLKACHQVNFWHVTQVETGVRAVLGFDGGIAVLTEGGRLAGLKERDLATRLDLLFAKGLHGVALNVAEAAQVHPVVRRRVDHQLC